MVFVTLQCKYDVAHTPKKKSKATSQEVDGFAGEDEEEPSFDSFEEATEYVRTSWCTFGQIVPSTTLASVFTTSSRVVEVMSRERRTRRALSLTPPTCRRLVESTHMT